MIGTSNNTETSTGDLLRRIISFTTVPFVSLISPFLILPIIASHTDPSGWAALGIGQSIGGLGSIAVAFGWPMVGPVQIANQPSLVAKIFFESLVTRGLVYVVCAMPIATFALVGSPEGQRSLTVAVASATATVGLSSSWVSVGLGRAKGTVLWEVLPRLAFLLSAAGIIHAGGSLLWYPAAVAGASALSVALFALFVVRPRISAPKVIARSFREQTAPAVTRLTGALYSAGALFIVGLSTSVHQTALLSSADRLYRIGLLGVVALSSGLQAWVIHPTPHVARARQRVALQLHVGLGLAGGASFAFLAPFVAHWLFGDELAPGYIVSFAYGLTFAALAPTTCLGQHFLLPAGKTRETVRVTITAAAVGVPLIALMSHASGAAGGAFALAIIELGVLFWLALLARDSWPRANVTSS